MPEQYRSYDDAVTCADAQHRRMGAAERSFLASLVEIHRRELWRETEAKSMAHWMSLRYGVSHWKADRWIDAAHALEKLPLVDGALCEGELGIDRVVELTRFASVSADSEAALLRWAQDHSSGSIRARADQEIRLSRAHVETIELDRAVSWAYAENGRRFEMWTAMPAAEGAVVIKGLQRQAEGSPVPPDQDGPHDEGARLADAFVGLCSARIAADADPDRATVVVHASLEQMASGNATGEIEGGGVIDAPVLERLACSARIQTVLEDADGNAFALGRMRREPRRR